MKTQKLMMVILCSVILLSILTSCLTTDTVADAYVYTEGKPLYPAVYQSIIDGAEKYKEGFSQTPLFKSMGISDVDMYANTFLLTDAYTVDSSGGVIGALADRSNLGHFYFDLRIVAKPNTEIEYTYTNVRVEKTNMFGEKSLTPVDDLPSKGRSGVPTIVNFFNENIAAIMNDEARYEAGKTKALSDPEFLLAVLKPMTELQRKSFFETELSQVTPTMELKISNVSKNTSSAFKDYEYCVVSYYFPKNRVFLSMRDGIRVTLYTNDQKVTTLSKDTVYTFSGKVVALGDVLGSNALILTN